MEYRNEWLELSRMLEQEWRGKSIDKSRLRSLAATLQPVCPEMRNTLSSIRRRLGM